MRNRILLIILFPITVFLWLAGWTLFWTGSQRKQNQPAAKEDVVEIAEPILKEAI
jgi:flagellar basal body-associated protein FliL